jgi:hypothetical protein
MMALTRFHDEGATAGCAELSRRSGRAVNKKPVARKNKRRIEQTSNLVEAKMVRLARESMALASVAGFVWMMCTVAHLVA